MNLKLSIFSSDGRMLRQIRELIKDLRYRNRQEKKKGELEVLQQQIQLANRAQATTDTYLVGPARLDACDAGRVLRLLIQLPQKTLLKKEARQSRKAPRLLDGNVPQVVGFSKGRNRMRAEQIREAQRAQPFHPFTMHLADGREFTVSHPDFLWISRTGRLAHVEDLAGNAELIDPMMVVSLTIPVAHSESPTS